MKKKSKKLEMSYWDKKKSVNYRIPFIRDKAIRLSNAGLATGAVLSTNLLDSIADNAYKVGLPIKTALGLVTKESTLGNPTDDKSAWEMSSAIRNLFNNKYPGTRLHINKENSVSELFLINYHKGLTEHEIFSGNNKPTGESILKTGFEFYKENPEKYNPGLKNYLELVDKRGNEVMNSPEIQKWYKDWEKNKILVMRPKSYEIKTNIYNTTPKKFGKYLIGGYILPSNVLEAINNGAASLGILTGVGKVMNKVLPEKVSKAMTFLSPLNYLVAFSNGSIDPRVGELVVSTKWHPNLLLVARMGEIATGPKTVKGVKAGAIKVGDSTLKTVAKAGNKTAKKAVIAREINKAVKENNPKISNRTISVDRNVNPVTGKPDLTYTLYNEFGEPIGQTNIGSATMGLVKREGSRKLDRMVDGIYSKNKAHKVSEDTYNVAVLDIIDNGGGGLESGWSLMSPLKTLTVTSKFPNIVIGLEFGNPVRLLTGRSSRPMPLKVKGNHYLEVKPKTEIKFNETKGEFEEVPIKETVLEPSTSLKFFERKPSKITEAERLGIPKGDRGNLSLNLKQAIEDLALYKNSGLYRLNFIVNSKGDPKWGTWNNKWFLKALSEEGPVVLKGPWIRTGYESNTGKGIVSYSPNFNLAVYSTRMFPIPEGLNWAPGEANMLIEGPNHKVILTAPKTDFFDGMGVVDDIKGVGEKLPSTIDKNIMKDFWINSRRMQRPGSYMSGDNGTTPLGSTLIEAFKKKLLHKTPVLERPIDLLFIRRTGLSPDSYSSIIRLGNRDKSLRWGEGFTKWNNSAVTNKSIYDAYQLLMKGEITPEQYEGIFNKWSLEIGGRPLLWTTIGEKKIPVHPHPYIYAKKQGGKMNLIKFLKKGSGIHIKKENRGKFTDYCGGKVTDECIRKAKASGNPTLVKRATFAANARKWKHQKGGIVKALFGWLANLGYKLGLGSKGDWRRMRLDLVDFGILLDNSLNPNLLIGSPTILPIDVPNAKLLFSNLPKDERLINFVNKISEGKIKPEFITKNEKVSPAIYNYVDLKSETIPKGFTKGNDIVPSPIRSVAEEGLTVRTVKPIKLENPITTKEEAQAAKDWLAELGYRYNSNGNAIKIRGKQKNPQSTPKLEIPKLETVVNNNIENAKVTLHERYVDRKNFNKTTRQQDKYERAYQTKKASPINSGNYRMKRLLDEYDFELMQYYYPFKEIREKLIKRKTKWESTNNLLAKKLWMKDYKKAIEDYRSIFRKKKFGGILLAQEGTKMTFGLKVGNFLNSDWTKFAVNGLQSIGSAISLNKLISALAAAAKALNLRDWTLTQQLLMQLNLEDSNNRYMLWVLDYQSGRSLDLPSLIVARYMGYLNLNNQIASGKLQFNQLNSAIDELASAYKANNIGNAIGGIVQNGIGLLGNYYLNKKQNTTSV